MNKLEERLRDAMALRGLPLGPDDSYMTTQILDAMREAMRIEREDCASVALDRASEFASRAVALESKHLSGKLQRHEQAACLDIWRAIRERGAK